VIDRRCRAPVPFAALLVLTVATSAAAQLTEAGTPVRPPGWSVTPAIGVSEMWDDNPTLAVEGDARPSDLVTSVRPSLALGFRGPRTTLLGNYTGNFDFYRDLTGLNTRDHRAGFDLTQQLTPHVQLFARNQAMLSPTTADAVEVSAAVLRRQTTRMNAFRGGIEAALARRTTLNLAYTTQWIDFERDEEPVVGLQPGLNLLQGGYSHGGKGELRHRVSQRVSIGADYDVQRAVVAGGTETIDVQSALGVTEFALAPSVSASLAYGHAWLAAGRNGFRDSGPAFNLGLDWQRRRTSGTLRYGRAFLPSFGFGGTFQNEELRATLRTDLTRWLQWTGGVAVSDNDPLEPGDPTLRSVSANTSLGWIVKRRLRLDGFVQHVSQDSGLAGGNVLRTRVGVQATVSQMVRATR
jgi:uncharacterized protein (PEP-CTERM system associated)